MPPKRSRNLRKKDNGDTDPVKAWDDEDNGKDNPKDELSIEEILYLQKQRSRQHGLSAEDLNRGDPKQKKRKSKSAKSNSEAPTSMTKGAGDTDSTDLAYGIKKPSVLGTFTTQTNALDVNKHMESYIEENLKKHRKIAHEGDSGEATGEQTKGRADNADLLEDIYQIPNHLLLTKEKPLNEGNLSLSTGMLTSIPEVDLGMEAKLKNIEMTEKAKREMSERAESSGDKDAESLSQDFDSPANLRYQRHRDISERHSTATDAAVAERFKQKFKR